MPSWFLFMRTTAHATHFFSLARVIRYVSLRVNELFAPSGRMPSGSTDDYCASAFRRRRFVPGTHDLWTQTQQLFLEMHVHAIMKSKNIARALDIHGSEAQRDHLAEAVGKQPVESRVLCTDFGNLQWNEMSCSLLALPIFEKCPLSTNDFQTCRSTGLWSRFTWRSPVLRIRNTESTLVFWHAWKQKNANSSAANQNHWHSCLERERERERERESREQRGRF